MTEINIKPCLAFEALGTVVFSSYYRDDLPAAKKWVEDNLSAIKVPCGNGLFSLLTEAYPLEEIERFDVRKTCRVMSETVDRNYSDADWHDDMILGLQKLIDGDFTELWEKHLFPEIFGCCESFLEEINVNTRASILRDVCAVRGLDSLPTVKIYISHFSNGMSFQLTGSSFLTSTRLLEPVYFMKLVAHELSHGFSDSRSRQLYLDSCDQDPFLKRTKWFLYTILGSTSDEEEYVQAVDRFISMRNGIRTREEILTSFLGDYRCSIPLAVIVFDELCKIGELPCDMNGWIQRIMTDGTVQIGKIEEQVDSIVPGYSDHFRKEWEMSRESDPEQL